MISLHENSWRIDKRVPLAVIVAMFLQIAGILVWATRLDARVDGVEKRQVGEAAFGEKLARIEERLENMKQDVGSIKRETEKLAERLLRK